MVGGETLQNIAWTNLDRARPLHMCLPEIDEFHRVPSWLKSDFPSADAFSRDLLVASLFFCRLCYGSTLIFLLLTLISE